jgi:lysophospholipase L1-like esterase
VKRLSSSRRFLSVLLAMVLCLVGTNPSALAQEVLPTFAISASSGWAGAVITISQVDPCPANVDDGQFVHATFTDAAGAVFYVGESTAYEGPWGQTIRFGVPSRSITSFDPITYSPEPAIGAGTLNVRCDRGFGGVVTRQYAPQTFTVTGKSLALKVTPTAANLGGRVVVSSVDPCPQGRTNIIGGIGGPGYVPFSATANSVDGHWSAVVTIPQSVPGPMPGSPPTSFPTGKYQAFAACSTATPESRAAYASVPLDISSAPISNPRYVAMGDSYSSGEGTYEYINTGNSCHRSNKSYVGFVAEKLELGDPLFVACSGAMTDDFYVANPKNANEPAQLERLNSNSAVVTLTIGGNDLGFDKILRRCLNYPGNGGFGCSKDQVLRRSVDDRMAMLSGRAAGSVDGRVVHKLADLYKDIKARAPQAKIYVGGYPRLFGSAKRYYAKNKDAPGGALCGLPAFASIAYDDAIWLNDRADEFNRMINDQVNVARAAGVDVTFVPAALFTLHGFCDLLEPYFNEVIFADPPNRDAKSESFHPTVNGYRWGYGEAFRLLMQRR